MLTEVISHLKQRAWSADEDLLSYSKEYHQLNIWTVCCIRRGM